MNILLEHILNSKRSEEKAVLESTDSRHPVVEGYEDSQAEFEAKCQANPTYKAAAAICSKYGYQIDEACYVEINQSGAKLIRFHVDAIDYNGYYPTIQFLSRFKQEPKFQIQTTSYGSLDLDEHAKFIDAVTAAHKMVAELSKLDLTQLYAIEFGSL